jgi:hypothetical protein
MEGKEEMRRVKREEMMRRERSFDEAMNEETKPTRELIHSFFAIQTSIYL